ncbi:MAG: hypothetical protein IPP94_13160 [Ignavibacteria bacterium]|nr:hypothetical protein [Ignavibacteria bacterium]
MSGIRAPALEALGERIDHFEKFANFEYQLGSEAAVLAYGRAVLLAEVGTAEALARRPVRAMPAPAPVTPAADSVLIDSIHIPVGAVSDITQRVRIFPPPCAKQDVIIPRLCDTLDAYAWRYYGFVPSLQGVTGASLERTTDGVVLRASTRDGDTAIFLSVRQARLLADFIGDYERKMRFYDGDGTLSAENIVRLGLPSSYVQLFERGLLTLRPSGFRGALRVAVRDITYHRTSGELLYASGEACPGHG